MFPEIKLSDSIVIPTYLLYLSVLYSFLIFYIGRRVERLDKPSHHAFNLALIAMVTGFIGARLLHVIFEMPRYYQEDWTRVFRFWDGGFVFFGGFLVSLIAAYLYTRRQKISFLEWMDFYAPVGALGYGLGRISCFLAGCCYGRSCDLPWAVQFSWDSTQTWRHPTQLYAVAWELVLFAILIGFEKRKVFLSSRGLIFFFWLTFHGVGRLMMESFRDDFRGELISGQSISTWVSLALIVVGIAGQIRSIALSDPPQT
jgi:phosphatidylglycerol:prolipoprotein diacylglycerol transferase